ncbi:MAG: ATP-binding protein [Anaerolineae bacterium]
MGKQNVLTTLGRFSEIKRLCQFVTAGAAQAGLSKKEIFHIELACDEACTNIIEHAYGGEDKGSIRVMWTAKDDKFIVSIHDNGRAFQPEKVTTPEKPDPDRVEKMKIGGLGIHFMRQLMDKVIYEFNSDGNTLTMIKLIKR